MAISGAPSIRVHFRCMHPCSRCRAGPATARRTPFVAKPSAGGEIGSGSVTGSSMTPPPDEACCAVSGRVSELLGCESAAGCPPTPPMGNANEACCASDEVIGDPAPRAVPIDWFTCAMDCEWIAYPAFRFTGSGLPVRDSPRPRGLACLSNLSNLARPASNLTPACLSSFSEISAPPSCRDTQRPPAGTQ